MGKATMGFRRSDLQEAFFVPGSYPFRVWGYGTTDPLEAVLARDYFRSAGGLMHPGDLIYVAVRPNCDPVSLRAQRAPAGAPAPQRNGLRGEIQGEMRMALVMVRGGENGAPSVRLVQDFGCPDDPDAVSPATAPPPAELAAPASATPRRRGRGRPPGSRTRKNAELATAEVNQRETAV
jgi:hypothetical protein